MAGIIGARGTPPSGYRGQAPACDLYAYRVFGKGKQTASSYSIAKAIDAAVARGCHLVNLSLGGGGPDEATSEAMAEAREAGCVSVASPYGKDKKDFVADFSNIGPETDLAGPGVGIISTVPGGYAAWNGTSMATPAICGRIAALWGADGTLRAMPANAERSARVIDASAKMLLVEAPGRVARQLGKQLPLWKISEEKMIELPPPLPRLRVRG